MYLLQPSVFCNYSGGPDDGLVNLSRRSAFQISDTVVSSRTWRCLSCFFLRWCSFFPSAFASPDHQAAAAADQGPFPGLPQRRHANCGWRGIHQRRAELHRGTGHHFCHGLCASSASYVFLWILSPTVFYSSLLLVASPCRAACRRQSVKMVAEAFRCVDYES